MKSSTIPLFYGIFVIMALSNAIVPVLPSYAPGSSLQGAIYSAYFLGAFVITLPAGILSDRFGRMPLLRIGLFLTIASGIFLLSSTEWIIVIASRFIEGLGAGIFVSVAMAYVNSLSLHRKESGILMAMMNAGLVSGLVLAGGLAVFFNNPSSGILVFTVLSIFGAGLLVHNTMDQQDHAGQKNSTAIPAVADNVPVWYVSIVLIGITGVVSSLYPQFSGMPPDYVGIWVSAMSISTVAAVLLASQVQWKPSAVIRWSAVLMAAGVGITFYSPLGFIVIGFLAGLVMVSIMEALSGQKEKQGMLMGLYSSSSYLGMALLPFLAGLIADRYGFSEAFLLVGFLALSVILISGAFKE